MQLNSVLTEGYGLGQGCGPVLLPGFCYHLIAKPGNKTGASSWPDPYKHVKTLRSRQNVHHFPDDISKFIFLNEKMKENERLHLSFFLKV